MAVFGRRSARQRLRRATEQALSVPTFRTPDDCTPWVLGGLWPAELTHVTPEIAPVAEYLKTDLQRIADSANYKLRVIAEAGMPEPARHVEQSRVIDAARAFATQRVESTVRQLRNAVTEPLPAPPERAADTPTQVIVLPRPPAAPAPPQVAEESEVPESSVVSEGPVVSKSPEVTETPELPAPAVESPEERLRRLIGDLARQEPGLRWAVGVREDGSTVVVTDLAHGWIPPGVDLPGGVEVLPPARRTGNLRTLLGAVEHSASYSPGDSFSWDHRPSVRVVGGQRRVPEVADLGWQLAEATRWREGLARITYTLAKAAAAGTGVVDAELDILRVHLDTARYRLVAGYPDIETAVLLNCLLLAATEALATGDPVGANYHFAWFGLFTALPPSNAGTDG